MTSTQTSAIETLKVRFRTLQAYLPASMAGLRLPEKAIIPLCIGAALTIAVASTFLFWQGDAWRPLFGSQELYDSGGVISVLDGQKIPFRLMPDSGQILVSAQNQARARMQMAVAGIKPNVPKGMEVLESDSTFGRSRFMEQTRYNQGLEGELVKTVMTLNGVRSARIHMAVPERTAFMRGQVTASASVLLDLVPGVDLDHRQVNAIIQLVAGSRVELKPENVSVLDQYGTLLTGQPDGIGLASRQITHTRQLERQYIERVLSLLEPVVGVGNIRVQATADVDYSIIEKTSEGFDPDNRLVRSESVSSEAKDVGSAIGVPGVASNQAGAATGVADTSQQQKSQAIRNFELGRTVSNVREASGQIRKLSVAIVVNSYVVGSEGWSPEQLALMTTLVRDAVGFKQVRGDTVTLESLPFLQPKPELIGWQALLKDYNNPVMTLGILALLLIMCCIVWLVRARRRRKRVASILPGSSPMNVSAVDMVSPKPQPTFTVARQQTVSLDQVRILADERPEAVAHILKQWIKAE